MALDLKEEIDGKEVDSIRRKLAYGCASKEIPRSFSWAHEVMEALATTGGVYLGTLRLWFDRFPLNSNNNPNAKYLLDMGTFAALNQFWYQVVAVEPKSADHWIWL